MQNLYIPSIGDQIELTKEFLFPLHQERRNWKFINQLPEKVRDEFNRKIDSIIERRINKEIDYSEAYNLQQNVTVEERLPAGAILTVDRIYVRKGMAAFDSITFNVPKKQNPGDLYGRFWMKLADANRIEFKTHGEKK